MDTDTFPSEIGGYYSQDLSDSVCIQAPPYHSLWLGTLVRQRVPLRTPIGPRGRAKRTLWLENWYGLSEEELEEAIFEGK